MKKLGILLVSSIIIVILQQAVFADITIFGVAFDAVFVYIVCISMLREDYECVIAALITGILRDSFFPAAFGINTVVYLVVAYVISFIQQRMYRSSIIMTAIFAFAASMIKGLLYFGYLYIISIKYDFTTYAVNVVLVECILNAIISIPIFKIVQKISNTEVMKREWKF